MKKRILLLLCLVLLISLPSSINAGIFTVPEWVQKSCVFLMKGEEPTGTGFLLWLKDQDITFCYLVTAKHVIQKVLSNSNAPLSVRFNLKEKGKAEVIAFPTFNFNGLRWLQHNNPAVDLAALPLSIFSRIKDLEVGGKKVENEKDNFFASSDWINRYKVGPGDQVFTLGLVPYLYSKDQLNLVLSRFGKISLLPEEEIFIPGGKQKAYFIDCQAFPGNSGGPAFVLIERTETGALIAGWRFALLGVVTEFVPSPLRGKKVGLQETGPKKKIQLIENTGITKVVPIDYLIEIIFSDNQKAFRKKILEAIKNRRKVENEE